MTAHTTTPSTAAFLAPAGEQPRSSFGHWLARLVTVGRRQATPGHTVDCLGPDSYRNSFNVEFGRRLMGQ